MLKRIGLFVCLLFVMSSCSDDVLEIEKRELHDYVSASLVENDDVIAFGSMGVKKILDKTGYQNIQMLKGLIAPELATINGVLGMDTPIYFVVEGPISPRGEAKRVIFFMKVKNSDALKKELEEERGFLVESQGDIQYTEDNDFVLGFRENLAIAVIQSDEFDASNLMEEMFAASQGPKSSGKEHELLETAGDVVLSVNLEEVKSQERRGASRVRPAAPAARP